MDSSVFDQTEFLLRAPVTGTGGLTQQLLTDTPVTRVAAFTADQLAKTALRGDHAFTGRLLEQTAGEMLGAGAIAQARGIEQPFSHADGEALGRGNRIRLWGNRV
ncbi:hypothetical protein RS1P1_09210 [Pseudomonas moraviensis]|nr:hypothetical protein RS1P1_09210 [Pseudomonas moraviensis]